MKPTSRFWRDIPTTAFGPEASDWIAVLPLAAIEQHGPHLPVGVDAIIAEGIVARCANNLPDDTPVVFLPVQQIAKSNEHEAFPGTLTVNWDTTIRSWIDIGASVARSGPRTLILVTSHGGNAAPMEIAARELRQLHNLRCITTSWGRLGNWQQIYAYDGPIIDIHAGLSETALMLALRPDLVDASKARDFPSAQTPLANGAAKLGYHGAPANVSWLAQDLNPEGAVGDAGAATAEAGERDIESIVAGFAALIRDLKEHPETLP